MIRATAHRWASPSTTTGSPRRIVWRTCPVSLRPANGVLRALLASRSGSTSQRDGGVDHAEVGGRARRDRAARGRRGRRSRPAATRAARARRRASARRARPARSSVSASAVSSPSIPGGASSNGRSFCLRPGAARGRWRWRRWCRRRARALIAATSASVRSGGCTLNTGSKRRAALVGEREVVRRGLGGDRRGRAPSPRARARPRRRSRRAGSARARR